MAHIQSHVQQLTTFFIIIIIIIIIIILFRYENYYQDAL